MNKSKKSKVLVIVAHPDDAELLFGGMISKHTRSGGIVEILIVTSGENWNVYGNLNPKDIKKIRRHEALEAGEILGVQKIHFMDLPDSFVSRDNLIPKLIELVREINPTYILTHSEEESHYDHKEVSYSVQRICNMDGEPAPIINPYLKSKFQPSSSFRDFFTSQPIHIGLDSRTIYFPISEKDMHRKIDAISCYQSQFLDMEKIKNRAQAEAQFLGSLSCNKYAEVIRNTTSFLNKIESFE